MNEDLILTLQNYWFSEKEAKIYLTALSLGAAPASSIARNANESRTTVYSVLWDLVKKWYCSSIVRENVTYFSAVSPEMLVKIQEQKYQKIKEKLPEFMALESVIWNKSKVQYYDWLEWFKTAYKQVILSSEEMVEWEPFLTMLWTQNINAELQKRLVNEFVPRRLGFQTKTKAIISKKSYDENDDSYADYNKSMHESIIIDDPFFDISNEIIIHGKDKVSIMLYWKDELSALVVQSQTLHDALKGLFMLIWNQHKK